MNRTPELIEDRIRTLVADLRGRGMSVTHQRVAVYRALLEDDTHPDAEDLYECIRGTIPSLSLGTVYKALDVLLDLGAIREVDAPRSATRYEAALEPHHHLVCDRCHRVVDLFDAELSKVRPASKAASGFEVSICTVQFHGSCRECAAGRTPRGADSGERSRPSREGADPAR